MDKLAKLGKVICVIFFGFVIVWTPLNIPTIKNLLTQYHLLPEPEKLTELYFEKHLELPNRIEIGKEQKFSFTIHNLEYAETIYAYNISSQDNENLTEIASGEAKLAHEEFKTFDITYQLATASGRTKVSVTLPEQDQQIHFWLEENK